MHPPLETQSSGSTVVEQFINLRRAAMLVPGTRWSSQGELLPEGLPTYPEQRLVMLGAQAPRLRRLATLPLPLTVLPQALRIPMGDAWCAVMPTATEYILIPCFELLRAFYYEAGGALVDYFASRVPLAKLCQPISAPSAATDFIAHFCVAARLTHPHQARVLAELLFNPAYQATIRQAHADLALAWYARNTRREHPHTHIKAAFHLGRSVAVTAHGSSFTAGGKNFFWVNRLVPADNWFGFAGVVYHPLGQDNRRFSSPFIPPPAFTDVLHHFHATDYAKDLSLKCWPGTTRHQLFPTASHLPPVVCSFPWARCLPVHGLPVYADKAAAQLLWEPSSAFKARSKNPFPQVVAFRAVIQRFERDSCLVERLTVNNPDQHYGKGLAAFPYRSPPSTATHASNGQRWPISLVHIEQGGGHFQVLQVAKSSQVILAYWEDVSTWTSEDYDALLAEAAQAYPAWSSLRRPTGLRPVLKFHRGGTAEVLVAWCYEHMRTAIADRNLWVEVAGQARERLSARTAADQVKWWHHWRANCYDSPPRYAGDYLGEPLLPTCTAKIVLGSD